MTKYIFSLFLVFSSIIINAQEDEVVQLNLNDVINLAKQQSPDAYLAKHRFRNSYWQFRTYKASQLPMLTFDATLPNFKRSYSQITQPDGSVTFQSQFQATSSMQMSLTQNVGLTGGQIFMNSGLQRIDLFGDSTITSYLSSPLNIGFRQPIYGFNQFKWNKKIEPVKYNEAKSTYIEAMEQVKIKAVGYFFDLLLDQINLEIAKINQANNDTLYKIAQGRYNYGKIAENELLQMELSLLNSNNQLEQAQLDVEVSLFRLKSFLAIKNDRKIELIPPVQIHDLSVNVSTAVNEARQNRSSAKAFDRRMFEAQSNVSKARTENRFNADIFAIYGLSRNADDLAGAYKNPEDEQSLVVGLQVPILDWGLAKGKIKMAESNLELEETKIEQEKIDFDQEVYLKVMQFNMQKNQLKIAAKADTIGRKRFYVTKQRYLIGKIDITELNIALTEKDQAKQSYIQTLRNFWTNFYEVRRLTLYDFLKNEKLTLILVNFMNKYFSKH
jgi:outer membrane protein